MKKAFLTLFAALGIFGMVAMGCGQADKATDETMEQAEETVDQAEEMADDAMETVDSTANAVMDTVENAMEGDEQ